MHNPAPPMIPRERETHPAEFNAWERFTEWQVAAYRRQLRVFAAVVVALVTIGDAIGVTLALTMLPKELRSLAIVGWVVASLCTTLFVCSHYGPEAPPGYDEGCAHLRRARRAARGRRRATVNGKAR
ncbi:hypothetical protein [Rhodanobacter sp. FW106-PBR-LB-2-11]|uniref:hypothetical protein n=1 Tax=Rhodanobacter sp. FW106-PBR-LB-2-11 TaxID=1524463 RepID=UPI0034E53438